MMLAVPVLALLNVGVFAFRQREGSQPPAQGHSWEKMVQGQKARTAAIREHVARETFDELVEPSH